MWIEAYSFGQFYTCCVKTIAVCGIYDENDK